MLGAHTLPAEVQSRILTTSKSHSNRQDAREALSIASMGKIQCHYALKPLSALSECVSFREPYRCAVSLIRSNLVRVYEGMEQGTVAGRVVLKMD